MHILDMNFIKKLVMEKIQTRVIRKNMFLRLLTNESFNYQAKDYELVINQMLEEGWLIEKNGFIRHKDSEDLTKLLVKHNSVRGIWATKT